ncbi:MAG: hypothetical protein IKW91_05755 [Bacteroidaceae bacterium]|nr:hypothetical protein [Bacteroidaceae bacterium]
MKILNTILKYIESTPHAGISRATGTAYSFRSLLFAWTDENGTENYLNTTIDGELYVATERYLQLGAAYDIEVLFKTRSSASGNSVFNEVKLISVNPA